MLPSSTSPEETSFLIDGLRISAKRWHSGAKHKAIALHGWLDNCGSFDLLAPELNNIDLIALDSAGHGNSDFRSADAQYLIWSEVSDIFNIAVQLGWDRFNLIGHSRGAGIAAIFAGTFPQQIEKLILLEGGAPLPMQPSEAPKNLAAHIVDNCRLSGTEGSLFKTRKDAIDARANGFTKITQTAAEILAARALIETPGGYRWHADARLKAPSSLKLSHQQIDAFLDSITAETLLLEGQDGILKKMPFAEGCLQNIHSLERRVLPGGHHFHMEEACSKCAALLSAFIEKDPC